MSVYRTNDMMLSPCGLCNIGRNDRPPCSHPLITLLGLGPGPCTILGELALVMWWRDSGPFGDEFFSLNCICPSKCWLVSPVDPCVLLHWVRHHGVSYLQSHRSAAMLQRASRYEPNVSFLSSLHSLGLLNVRPGQGFRPKQRDGQGNLMPAKREKRLGVRTLCVPIRRLLSFLLHVDIQTPSCRPIAKPNIPK